MGKRMEEAIKRYYEIQEKNLLGGGIKHIERQHNRGKLTAQQARVWTAVSLKARATEPSPALAGSTIDWS
jgi:hypothetical protein